MSEQPNNNDNKRKEDRVRRQTVLQNGMSP